MAASLNDPCFWSGFAAYQKLAHRFTAFYAERAWTQAELEPGARVLDIAAGTGALALAAAKAGAQVLATDFSPGMVDAVRSHGLTNVEAAVMDGQALDLPDASFDAAFSMFGIMLFPDWRAGLAEMARVLRPGGLGCVGTWKEPAGAAANLLLARLCAALFPEIPQPAPIEGMNALRDPGRFAAELESVGLTDISIGEVSTDYPFDAETLADPNLFQFSPLWPELDGARRKAVLAALHAGLEAQGGLLPVPSPALIGMGRKRSG
ncbi:class I SAM-dependent methyltransferase [Sphingosinicella terrae]|uniref:class I SAM-dependent methyltransferase n=1 Tax=Sphingosinicella terrae TaxID=2172047 RepID=UPI000E0D21E9|nr:class I SAM-dependent methyltransferase [Sphingosinicella terrae]